MASAVRRTDASSRSAWTIRRAIAAEAISRPTPPATGDVDPLATRRRPAEAEHEAYRCRRIDASRTERRPTTTDAAEEQVGRHFRAVTRKPENVFDPGKEQHTGIVLGIALASYRDRDGDDRFWCCRATTSSSRAHGRHTAQGNRATRSRSSTSTKAR